MSTREQAAGAEEWRVEDYSWSGYGNGRNGAVIGHGFKAGPMTKAKALEFCGYLNAQERTIAELQQTIDEHAAQCDAGKAEVERLRQERDEEREARDVNLVNAVEWAGKYESAEAELAAMRERAALAEKAFGSTYMDWYVKVEAGVECIYCGVVAVMDDLIDHILEAALRVMADKPCEDYPPGYTCFETGLTEPWCNPCIARAALEDGPVNANQRMRYDAPEDKP